MRQILLDNRQFTFGRSLEQTAIFSGIDLPRLSFGDDYYPGYEPKIDKLSLLGQEVSSLKLSNIKKDNTIDSLGKEIVKIKMQSIKEGI